MTELRTDRLLMRRWRPQDREPFAAIASDPEVQRYYPATLTRGESDAFVDRLDDEFEERGWGLWALEIAGTGEFIGYTGLEVPSFEAHFTPAVEVGWRLARTAWGHGYASEAARAATAYGFGELGLEEIVSFTAVQNARSRAVMERIGMTFDGEFDHPGLPEGHWLRRHVLYRLNTAPRMIELWRTDDHGNDFFMRSFASVDEAERVRAQFEARGHHQTYWLRDVHGPTESVETATDHE